MFDPPVANWRERGNEMIESRIDYIHQNPVRAGIVEFEHEYLYSSARNFSELDGLIEIDAL